MFQTLVKVNSTHVIRCHNWILGIGSTPGGQNFHKSQGQTLQKDLVDGTELHIIQYNSYKIT